MSALEFVSSLAWPSVVLTVVLLAVREGRRWLDGSRGLAFALSDRLQEVERREKQHAARVEHLENEIIRVERRIE